MPEPGPTVHDGHWRADRVDAREQSERRSSITAGPGHGNAWDATVPERELVAAVLAGQRDAFRPLVEREGPALVRACYRILGDLSEAEDTAQEAFVIAYRSLATWRSDGPFGAWLARIGVRLAIRRARGRRSVVRIDVPRDAPAGSSPGHGSEVLELRAPSERHDPAVMVAGAERTAELRRAVARLGEPHGEVVALRFFGERSLAEIAEVTGRPLSTVKTHLRRGLLRLREDMGSRTDR